MRPSQLLACQPKAKLAETPTANRTRSRTASITGNLFGTPTPTANSASTSTPPPYGSSPPNVRGGDMIPYPDAEADRLGLQPCLRFLDG